MCIPYWLRNKASGFTLIELLLVIALAAGLLVVAMVSYQRWIVHDELLSVVRTFENTLDFARESAITSHREVEVCPVGEKEACGTLWEAGLQVRDLEKKTVLRVTDSVPERFSVSWRPTLAEKLFLRFNSEGFVSNGAQGSFYICAKERKDASARIILLRTGRLRLVTGHFDACQP